MPVVPFSSRAPAGLGRSAAPATPPPLDWGLIAAAQMHSEGRLIQVAEKKDSLDVVTKHMNDDEYDDTWVKSVARKGRSDEQMRALEPALDAYRLGEESDLITYHKRKPPPEQKPEDLVS